MLNKIIQINSCWLTAIALIWQINITSAKANTPVVNSQTPITKTTAELSQNSEEVTLITVGVTVGKRNVIPSTLVRGKENGTEVIDFENWVLSYEAVIQALKLNVTTLADGQLEVRSPGVVTRIDPKKLRSDAELGLVFSIADLQRLFGVTAKFDIKEYAIVLEIPWLNQSSQEGELKDSPVVLEGLPLFKPGTFNVAAIEQKVNASSTTNSSTNYRGDFLAVGNIGDGSWFVRVNQQDLQNQQTWNITEAQFLRQTNQTDYFVGSHPTFWQSQATGDYWGFTFIERQGFAPSQSFGGGSSDPRQRLQTNQIGRTITGKAQPGTLVRLVPGFGYRVIAEVLVDSSGIYRFENIKSENQLFGSNYRVLLYPEGRLTAQPELREATFSTVLGQIPAGTSAWVVSGGWKRELAGNESFLGEFSQFRGGISGRWGLSENLTFGLGGVYDESLKGLAEIFYRPTNIPLQIAVSALTGNESNVIADIRYEPSAKLSAVFTNDFLSSRFNVNWNVFSGFSLFATSDSRDATGGGMQFNFSNKNFFTFARVSLDTENRWRWNLLQRLGQMELKQQGSEIGTFSELTYNLSQSGISGNSLLLDYETRSLNGGDNLLTLGWRYRSPKRLIDGSYLWEAQLGYGLGSQGDGIIASLGTRILPGLMLRGRYQGISLTSDEATFSVDLLSNLNLQAGIAPGDMRSDYFRTQGGLLVQLFFDRNNNGKRDSGEEVYTDNLGTMLLVNNRSLNSLQPDIKGDRINIRLHPGIYRLDFDPAGFPPDWQPAIDSIAVDVVAGSYTPVMIPIIRSYTRSGVVSDAQNQAIAGAKVEAIQSSTGQRRFSVTNSAGVYYLEGLQQGNYELQINGKAVGTLKLEESSDAFQELNLQPSQAGESRR
ncbi:hypothetical protein NIES2111_26780 [Nostoc sp. NIES-2111]|nr:hypothetical protein NIES2111_26780 [Nostoc sp. NIES-2111]